MDRKLMVNNNNNANYSSPDQQAGVGTEGQTEHRRLVASDGPQQLHITGLTI